MAKIQAVEFPLNLGTVDELTVKAIQMNMESDFCLIGFELAQSNVQMILPNGNVIISNKTVSGGSLRMEGTDYQNWKGDNFYVIEWVANKLGVVLI